jgi:hypothetical protein
MIDLPVPGKLNPIIGQSIIGGRTVSIHFNPALKAEAVGEVYVRSLWTLMDF